MENNAINKQTEDLIIDKAAGDPFVNFKIASVDKFTLGVDDDDSDYLKLTTGASPSAGTQIFIAEQAASNFTFNYNDIRTQPNSVTYDDPGIKYSFLAQNLDTTNTSSNAAFQARCGAAGGDPYLEFCISGAACSFVLGVDNSDSDILKINKATTGFINPSSGTNVWQMTLAGERTMPLQPAFLAYNSANDANQTGNGTLVTVDFDTEVFDQNSDFVADTFTAPVTGRYSFETTVNMYGLTAAMTQVILTLVTSNRSYRLCINNIGAIMTSGAIATAGGKTLADMDAADTALVQVVVSNGAGDTAGIAGSSSPHYTTFSGRLEV